MNKTCALLAAVVSLLVFGCSEPNERAGAPGDAIAAGKCGLCHGQTVPSLPPADASHAYHVDSLGYECSRCHLGYTADRVTNSYAVNPLTHMNGRIDVIFSFPWNDSGKAAYDIGAKQCSNVYCHGGIPQGTHATVSWVGGSPINQRCYACHDSAGIATYHYGHARLAATAGTPPRGGTVQFCYKCHDAAYSVPLKTVDPVKHLNGVFDRATCKTCHLTWTTWEEYAATHPGAKPFGKVMANGTPVSMP
jgi:predicted CxxxxCH...CXXCH cytochrome family protein